MQFNVFVSWIWVLIGVACLLFICFKVLAKAIQEMPLRIYVMKIRNSISILAAAGILAMQY